MAEGNQQDAFLGLAPEDEKFAKNLIAKLALSSLSLPLTVTRTLIQLGHEPFPLSTGKTLICAGRNAYFLPNAFSYMTMRRTWMKRMNRPTVTTMLILMILEKILSSAASQVSNDLNCLTSKNFKISRIHEILNFLETLFTSREHESFLLESKEIMSQFSNMRDAFIKVNDFLEKNRDKDFSGDPNNPVLKLKEPAKVAATFGSGVRALFPVWLVYQHRGQFLETANFSKNVQDLIGSSNNDSVTRNFWATGSASLEIRNLVGQMDALNSWSEYVQDKDILEFRNVFELAKNITGFKGQDKTFSHISKQLWEYDSDDLDFDQALNNSEHLLELNLDFTNFEGELQAAKLSFLEIKDYFDEIFGLKTEEEDGKIIENSYLLVICISIPVFFLLVICIFGKYTPAHALPNACPFLVNPCRCLSKVCSKLFFMDRQDGQNALIEAVREIHASHVREIVRGGAYINVYSQHGNTCLHMATKRGYAEIVEILIKNGADRSLLNSQNKTPEQMLNTSYRTTQTDSRKLENYEKIEKIYKKSKNKKYRIRVPDIFPSSSFHIFADKNTDDELTNRFMNQFSAIVMISLVTLVTTHGGIILEQFPEKSQFNIGSHPYLHAHLGPLFIIHDGQTNLESYKNDTDKMYTLFTEEEFIHFMLKRMINVDKSENPISVLVDGED
ncbi:Protein CBG09197 [Caenorhabditis briggsae]|uniref:Protein CBG09197 n=1 Tax=Caenorhabditis briggsae TaxID=6238 RepID=H8WH62_CAEBR|nr:Protein CBG09197 [Caenorhabditis briggsae]CCG58600.1 Protein CBG09197 [Caenorhabditis briggsae]